MDEHYLMIGLRLLHILGGVFWVGSVAALAWFVLPAQQGLGASGVTFMMDLMLRRKLRTYIGLAMMLTVLSGLAMYVRLSMVSDGAFSASRTGMTFGFGAMLAILAAGIGGGIAGRTGEKMAKLAVRIQEGGVPPTEDQRTEMTGLAARQGWALRTTAVLLFGSVAAMAIARYL
ncbi:MAG TPA: hypothetical protein VHM24_12470 [Gemmatimonadaceae bacterium]|nr:hypothetical protein [Gemmatimonadaceae bacterium]